MADPGSGIDLILAVATHAEEEAAECVSKAAGLRARAAALDVRIATLRQMHAIATGYQAQVKREDA